MESFQYLVENVPLWIDKLQLLSQQVTERQAEFNRLSQSMGGSPPLIRKQKTGSTESLKAVDLGGGIEAPAVAFDNTMPPPPTPTSPPVPVDVNPNNKRLFQEHRDQRRKRKSASIVSGPSGPHKFRSRMSLIVYYDSSIQQGFEWLVRGVASARNNLRKGKLAASYKTRMAAMHMEESPFDGDRTDLSLRNPKIPRFQKSSKPFSVDALALEQFEVIDKDLETAQTLCEVGAHQFLRDADCNDELAAIKQHFENSMKVAKEQYETMKTEEEEEQLRQPFEAFAGQEHQKNTMLAGGGIEVDGEPSQTQSKGGSNMAVQIDDSGGIEIDRGIEIDDAYDYPQDHGVNSGMIEVDNEPSNTKTNSASKGLLEVDDTPQIPSGGLGSDAIEVDDNSEDNYEPQIDLAAFLQTKRRR